MVTWMAEAQAQAQALRGAHQGARIYGKEGESR